MADLENQVHLECIICKDANGSLKSRNEFFHQCTCQQVVFHDPCWNDFINSGCSESCPTCRKALNRQALGPQRSYLRPLILQPDRNEQNEQIERPNHRALDILDQQNEEDASPCFRRCFEFCLFLIHGCIDIFCLLSLTNESLSLQIQGILIIQSFYSTYNCISSFLDFFVIPSSVSTILDMLRIFEMKILLISQTIAWPFNCLLKCMCNCVSLWSLLASGRLALYITMLIFLGEASSSTFAYIVFIMQIGEISFYLAFFAVCSCITFCLHCVDVLLQRR